MSEIPVVVIRLTPWQTRKLQAQFRKVREASEKGAKGILAGQFYAPGDLVHGQGRQKVAVARVGFLRHEYATVVSEKALTP